MLDTRLLRLMRTRGHWQPLERCIIRFSSLGEHSMIWLAVVVAGMSFDRTNAPIYRRLARTIVVVEVANALTKIAIGRKRPRLRGLPALMTTRSDRSCPSAHAASSFAAARVLSTIWPPPPTYVIASAMALTRPYLGVHYPSDVVLGALLGTAIAEGFGGVRPGD
jgi:membrane-associated phospholipid phosphatase